MNSFDYQCTFETFSCNCISPQLYYICLGEKSYLFVIQVFLAPSAVKITAGIHAVNCFEILQTCCNQLLQSSSGSFKR